MHDTPGISGGLAAIRWPAVAGDAITPEWTGHGFRLGERALPFLTGELGDAGWTDDLAEVLAAEASADRPIGQSSRRYALNALKAGGALGRGRVVMDIGCSSGHMLADIRAASPETEIVGSDYAAPPLLKLAERYPDIPLIQLDLVRSKLPDKAFNGITLINVLEHIEDDLGALRQVRRMLKSGGTLALEVPAGAGLYDPFDRLMGHYRRYRMPEIVEKVQSTGFEIVDRSHLGFFAYPAFWRLKKRNQKLSEADESTQREALMRTLRSGRPGLLPRIVFGVEDALRPILPMPFGIRCLVAARARD